MSKALTPAVAQLPEDPNAETKAIVERLIAVGQRIDINLPETLAEQQQWVLAQHDQYIAHGVQMGYGLVVIKQQLEHGEFIAWLQTAGINKSTAQRNMKVAKFLAALDENHPKRGSEPLLDNPHLDPDLAEEQEIDAVLAKIIKLPRCKQLILTKETPERIREYMQADLFAEIDTMSTTEIKTIIRQQKEIERLRKDNGDNSHRLYVKHNELEKLKKLPKQHVQMDVMRKQILQDCELVQGAMQRMRLIFEGAKHFTHEFNEDAKNLIAFPALHTLDAIQGHAYEISNNYRDRWSISKLMPVGSPCFGQLDEDELLIITEAVQQQQAATQEYTAELEKMNEQLRKDKRK